MLFIEPLVLWLCYKENTNPAWETSLGSKLYCHVVLCPPVAQESAHFFLPLAQGSLISFIQEKEAVSEVLNQGRPGAELMTGVSRRAAKVLSHQSFHHISSDYYQIKQVRLASHTARSLDSWRKGLR